MAFLTKDKEEILHRVLQRIQAETPITSTSPGSVMRSLAEAMCTEIGDLYSVLDFNFSLQLLSQANGRALDLMGNLYGVQRKTLNEIATLDASLGAFYFYIDSPIGQTITIPAGTSIFTDSTNLIGRTFTYETTSASVISAGHTRAYASIRPSFSDSVYTAGINTLTLHNFTNAPNGVTLRCKNVKVLSAKVGYELDDNFRIRIIKAVRTAAGGTSEAIRLAALGIQGVRDVTVRDTPFGLGSFQLVVVFDNNIEKNNGLATVRQVVDKVRPVGVGFYLIVPNEVITSITVDIAVSSATDAQKANVRSRVEVAILRFINRLSIGEKLVYNRMLQAIFESAPEFVQDVIVSEYLVNGQEVIKRDFTPSNSSILIPGRITVNLTSI